ncbi:hypothetical protein KIH74_34945 [Kineosporia sp. J2-2]|uniref:DUF5753 domain-containing protein n=1 Tax=Kineosporia corallincola TaxID=2835133 RepID=A0ABS5TTS0_9ACTN|nr:DUF5753 domain-containing protein [Kineosporia corallincola]MBT0774195.1 hypothetical protein [Kineosporia corallincola]
MATVEWVCKRLGAPSDLSERMSELAERANGRVNPSWYEKYIRKLGYTRGFDTLLELEPIAETIRVFSPIFIPGILQIPEYQLALFDVAPGLTKSNADKQVALQAKRQNGIVDRGIRIVVVITEGALRLQVGGPEVHREQLSQLVALHTADLVEIRVWSSTAGAHPGGRGEIELLTFPKEEGEPPFAYSEGYQGAECTEESDAIADHEERWSIIRDKSVPINKFAPIKELAA